MNHTEELSKFLLTTLKETKDFVVEQAPAVVREVLVIETIGCAAWVVVCAAWVVVCAGIGALVAKMSFHVHRKSKEVDRYGVRQEELVVAAVLLGLLSTLSFSIAVAHLFEIAKIQFAPKAYLFQMVAESGAFK
jgi:hypothetical protein